MLTLTAPARPRCTTSCHNLYQSMPWYARPCHLLWFKSLAFIWSSMYIVHIHNISEGGAWHIDLTTSFNLINYRYNRAPTAIVLKMLSMIMLATVWTTRELIIIILTRIIVARLDHLWLADTGVWSEKPVPAHGVTLPRACYNIHNTYSAHLWRYLHCKRLYTTHTHIHIWIYPMGITHVVNHVITHDTYRNIVQGRP